MTDGDWRALAAHAEALAAAQHTSEALQCCARLAHQGPAAQRAAALLRGRLLLELGDAAGALSSLESVAELGKDDAEVDCARGLALFELCRFSEASSALTSALRSQPQLAAAHYTLGLIAELQRSGAEDLYYREAARLEGEKYPPVFYRSASRFSQLVTRALQSLPPQSLQALAHVSVVIEPMPSLQLLGASDPPLSPRTLCVNCYIRSLEGDSPKPQRAFILYRRNLERAYPEDRDLESGIRKVLLAGFLESLAGPGANSDGASPSVSP